MKKLLLVGLRSCAHCLRVVAFLNTEDEKQKVEVGLDPWEGRELARIYHRQKDATSLTELLRHLLDVCGYVPRMVIFDCGEDEVLVARLLVDKDGEIQTRFCSPSLGLRLSVAAGALVYATDELFVRRQLLFHTPFFEDGSTDLLEAKPRGI